LGHIKLDSRFRGNDAAQAAMSFGVDDIALDRD